MLHWEGEEKHSSDSRIVNAKAANEEIHLFYRDIHHTPFTYYGQVLLKTHQIHTTSPSQFIFSLINDERRPDIFEDIEIHQREFKALEQTEKEAVVKSRIGQGVFRERVIELWGSCAVTDLANTSMLRASHIKPWRDSSNQERLDPMNGLLLQPNLDHLFDLGFITFDGQGVIMFSPTLSSDDIQKLGLTPSTRLRKLPDQLAHYLDYHRTSVFKRD
nr:HNH endonuclease [Shewanella submarina]